MTLTNKKTQYSVVNENNNASLRGELSFNETSGELTINGSVTTLENEFLGNFYYNLSEAKNVDQNFNNVKDQSFDVVETIVDATIAEVREHFNA